jgi:hypothetical protein
VLLLAITIGFFIAQCIFSPFLDPVNNASEWTSRLNYVTTATTALAITLNIPGKEIVDTYVLYRYVLTILLVIKSWSLTVFVQYLYCNLWTWVLYVLHPYLKALVSYRTPGIDFATINLGITQRLVKRELQRYFKRQLPHFYLFNRTH